MPVIKVYHNSNFLDYRGNHADIVPPIQSIATVQVPDGMPVEQALEIAYQQTQHLDDVDGGWWNRKGVTLYVRSTSVGDVLADAQGNLFVVESAGFRPYQPKAICLFQRLAEAYRLLDEALAGSSTDRLVAVVNQVRNSLRHVLEIEGDPKVEASVLTWDEAQPGDLVGNRDMGLFRVIARRMRPKWRAKRLLAHIPGAQVWIDNPRTWAVLVPVMKEGATP